MERNKFIDVAANPNNKKWSLLIERQKPLYSRTDDIRSDFGRDYTRILHSLAYRRLKHKTQVFFNISNDHVCTRIEHVQHVESVSHTLAQYLGLNTELTKAIATGHDLGHAPFGHHGETVIKELTLKHLGNKFWHEKNGLYIVDELELLENNNRSFINLDLTYAVRDGIVAHCGEIDANGIHPRDKYIDLIDFNTPGQYEPFTWEGCVVKIADKIAYLGRDIEDAVRLRFIEKADLFELKNIARKYKATSINTTVIMHSLIMDICENSTPETGIYLGQNHADMLQEIKDYNYRVIYNNEKFRAFKAYAALIINQIFDTLLDAYDGEKTIRELRLRRKTYPELMFGFSDWLIRYCDLDFTGVEWANNTVRRCKNKKIYGKLSTKEEYIQAVIDYISGMTDKYAIQLFEELIHF